MNMIEKILAKAGGKKEVRPGDVVLAHVDAVLIHDFGMRMVSEVFEKEAGEKKVLDPDRVVIVFDHWFSPPSEEAAKILKGNREFAKRYGIKNVFDGGAGICHHVLIERGFVRPGSVIVGTDSHTTAHGAFGAFATGVGNQSHAALSLARASGWFKVPETMKVLLTGSLQHGVTPRDVIQYVIGYFGEDGAVYKAIEYDGDFLRSLPLMQRFIFPLMSVEMGAKTGFIQPDEATLQYLSGRCSQPIEPVYNDPDVEYEAVHEIDVSKIEPIVGCPPAVSNNKPVGELSGISVDQAVIGGCPSATIDELREAANILKGKTVHPEVRMSVIPGTREIYSQASKEGLLDIFYAAGADIFPASCGPCQTVNMGAQAEGERMISTLPRNYPGRTGSPKAEVYLASPLTVAASAVKGEIADPREYLKKEAF